jgi:hypothetical protein
MTCMKTAGISALLAGSFVLGRASAPRVTAAPTATHDSARLAEPTSATLAVEVAPELEPAPPDAPRSIAGPAVLTESSSSEIRELSVCEAFSLLSKALRDHPLENGEDASFCEKYRGATLEQFQTARALIRKRYESERQRIVDERLQDGRYEVRAAGEEPFRVSTAKGSGPVAFGFTTQPRSGSSETRTTTIPAEEYPEFSLLELEWFWLERQARVPDSVDCDR